MIISKTPYRISFAGGMSDIPSHYNKNGGCVVSTSINKYIYITVNRKFDGKYKITYNQGEEVDSIDDIKHPLIRECLKYTGINHPIEIVSIADVPGGSGLGSSSSFTVGLLNALYRYQGRIVNKYKLAEDACRIEIDILKEPIGKQDQYAAVYGGLNRIDFKSNSVSINPINISNLTYNNLDNNLMLFYTGKSRAAKSIFDSINLEEDKYNIINLSIIAKKMSTELKYSNIGRIPSLLNREWNIKKKIGDITNSKINDYIGTALKCGARGCKLCGAGSDGYLLVYCQPSRQLYVKNSLGLKELPFKFEEKGSRIIYESRERN